MHCVLACIRCCSVVGILAKRLKLVVLTTLSSCFAWFFRDLVIFLLYSRLSIISLVRLINWVIISLRLWAGCASCDPQHISRVSIKCLYTCFPVHGVLPLPVVVHMRLSKIGLKFFSSVESIRIELVSKLSENVATMVFILSRAFVTWASIAL